MALTVLICYDISDDDRRAKVAARLQQWGDRIQYSVFLCTLTPDDLADLIPTLTDLIDTDTDSHGPSPMRYLLERPPRHRPGPTTHT